MAWWAVRLADMRAMSDECEVVDNISGDERRGCRYKLWFADCGWSKDTVEDGWG